MKFSIVKKKRILISLLNQILNYTFVTVLIFLVTLIFTRLFYLNAADKMGLKEKKPIYNAIAEYPFNATELTDINLEAKTKDNILFYKNQIMQIENKISLYCTEYLIGRIYAVILKKTIDKLLGLNMTSSMGVMNPIKQNDVVTSFDGEWLGSPLPEGSSKYRDRNIKKVIKFSNLIKSQGRNFFIFENPSKFCNQLGYKNSYNKNREIVNYALRNNGIEILDLDDYIKENQINYRDIFFKTDHHWKPSSGLWANKLLCNYMNEHFGYGIDNVIFNLENYDIKIYERQFLGSLGKKVTEVYSRREDFELITPKYNNNVTVFSSETCESRTGSIEEVFYYMDVFKERNIYARNEYALYTNNANTGLIISHNNLKDDGSSLLLIHLSFADVQIPFLTQAFENFYAVDLRFFNGSLETLIKKTNPATVVLAYPTTEFQEDTSHTFMRDMFDFN